MLWPVTRSSDQQMLSQISSAWRKMASSPGTWVILHCSKTVGPETAVSYQASFDSDLGKRVHLHVALFHNRIGDMIETLPVAQKNEWATSVFLSESQPDFITGDEFRNQV